MAGLPLDRHNWHSNGITPCARAAGCSHTPKAPPAREPESTGWAHPALTGLATADWDQLISTLATAHQAQRHAALYIRRGGPPTRKPAGGRPPALGLAEQTLVTVLPLFPDTASGARPALRSRHRHHQQSRTRDTAPA